MTPGAMLRMAQAAMRFQGGEACWLAGLSEALCSGRPGSLGTVVYQYKLGADGLVMGGMHVGGRAVPELNINGLAALAPEQVQRVYGASARVTTAAMEFGGHLPSELEKSWSHLGVADVFGLQANCEGQGLLVASVETSQVAASSLRSYEAFPALLRASLRLQRGLAGASLENCVEAIFDDRGEPLWLGARARRVALGWLRERVQRRQAAGEKAGRDEVGGWEVWAGFCEGRYQLVDHVDVDGRTYVLLVEEPCEARALTEVERRIAELCGQAWGNKQIGFQLGLSESSVENHVARILGKLGLDSRVALVRLFTGLESLSALLRCARTADGSSPARRRSISHATPVPFAVRAYLYPDGRSLRGSRGAMFRMVTVILRGQFDFFF